MNPIEAKEEYLIHYGTKRHSGRYPWGSGENPYQHEMHWFNPLTGKEENDEFKFIETVDEMRASNYIWKDPKNGKEYSGNVAIAYAMGMSTTDFRTLLSLAKDDRRLYLVNEAKNYKEQGLSNSEIARRMGFNNESSVRSLLNTNSEARMQAARNTADILREAVDKQKMIDVGAGVDSDLGVSREKLNEALAILKSEGYKVLGARQVQATNRKQKTTLRVLCAPEIDNKYIYDNPEKVGSVKNYSSADNGETFNPTFVYPKSMDSSRVSIRYAEDGGAAKDGVLEIRRGVDDLDMGASHYAQVRILVDNNRYLKGMAIYGDDKDFPPGVDIIFNTNKTKDVAKLDVLKKIGDDPENPFGSLIKSGINDPDDPNNDNFRGGQSYYYDKNGNKQLSLINKRSEQGDWSEWSDKVPSQFLSKQSKQLAKRQLDLTLADKRSEFDDIMSLTNPTIKRRLLYSFADDCDAAAVHLKATKFPDQKYKVILPLNSIKDTEVYAPSYKDGITVALVRYPHAGTFEIPILKVNNKQPEGKKVITNSSQDAIGINIRVAQRMSGADFDGDTVMVIPCNSPQSKTTINSTKPLRGLENFDPSLEYATKKVDTGKVDKKGKPIYDYYNSEGKKVSILSEHSKQIQMGIVSNLITDMTIKGATEEEMAKAVRHSMVVIDAVKHELDYKQSEVDNDIQALRKEYQLHPDSNGKYTVGASTLISRSKNEIKIPKRRGSGRINPETGEMEYKNAEPGYFINKNGKKVKLTQKSTQMAETKDARSLVSDVDPGNGIESIYADYANACKALANEARKAYLKTPRLKYSPSAAKTYAKEVASLNAALNIAERNAPRERKANALAVSKANERIAVMESGGDKLTEKEKGKVYQQEIVKARAQFGAKRTPIDISDREWEAIQAGAISDTRLEKILKHTDIDKIQERATPKGSKMKLSDAKIAKIKIMLASGYTIAQIAEDLHVSSSTVSNYI